MVHSCIMTVETGEVPAAKHPTFYDYDMLKALL